MAPGIVQSVGCFADLTNFIVRPAGGRIKLRGSVVEAATSRKGSRSGKGRLSTGSLLSRQISPIHYTSHFRSPRFFEVERFGLRLTLLSGSPMRLQQGGGVPCRVTRLRVTREKILPLTGATGLVAPLVAAIVENAADVANERNREVGCPV